MRHTAVDLRRIIPGDVLLVDLRDGELFKTLRPDDFIALADRFDGSIARSEPITVLSAVYLSADGHDRSRWNTVLVLFVREQVLYAWESALDGAVRVAPW